jgi:hypothetical protein
MNSPIALREFDEDEYGSRLRTPSDDDPLREFALVSCRVNLRECPILLLKSPCTSPLKMLSWTQWTHMGTLRHNSKCSVCNNSGIV